MNTNLLDQQKVIEFNIREFAKILVETTNSEEIAKLNECLKHLDFCHFYTKKLLDAKVVASL